MRGKIDEGRAIIVGAVITAGAAIVAAIITGGFAVRVAASLRESEATSTVLADVATRSLSTQASLRETVEAPIPTLPPTHTIPPTYTLPPTYTSYPTYTQRPTLTSVPSPSPTSTVAIELPFQDGFDGGLGSEWRVLAGDWRIANGRLTTLSRQQYSYVVVGDPGWRNYAIEVDFERLPVQILARVHDVDNYVVFGLELNSSYWRLRSNGQWFDLIYGDGSYWHTPSNGRGRLRVEVRGDFFTAFFDDEFWLSINDTSLAYGAAGLSTFCEYTCASFDDYSVIELSE